jgi:hypothetical protein
MLVEIMFSAGFNVVPHNRDVLVTVFTSLFVIESYCVTDFVNECPPAPTPTRSELNQLSTACMAYMRRTRPCRIATDEFDIVLLRASWDKVNGRFFFSVRDRIQDI